MKAKFLSISGVKVLTRENLKTIQGSSSDLLVDASKIKHDLSLCGCDCAGNVTGPDYCFKYLACPAVYWCDDTEIM